VIKIKEEKEFDTVKPTWFEKLQKKISELERENSSNA
jgi:hypothetical protein